MSQKNLYQRIVAIMDRMGAVGKGGKTAYGERYAYHRIDDIDDALRQALVAEGVVATITTIDNTPLEHFEGTDRQGKPRTTWYAECKLTIELVNADKPEERTCIQGWGQGLDYSDKATGKAISYAAKAAYLSAFHLRGQPDNESDDIPRGRAQTTRDLPRPNPPRPAVKPPGKQTPMLPIEDRAVLDRAHASIPTATKEDLETISEYIKGCSKAVQAHVQPLLVQRQLELEGELSYAQDS
jgi:hypothetical protein